MMLSLSRAVLPVAMLALFSACEGTPSEVDPQLWTDAGLYHLVVTPEAEPQVSGDAVLHIAVEDEAGEGVSGAQLVVTPWMPSMGHGVAEVAITEPTPAHYEAAFAYSMPGAWDITIEVTAPAGTDQAVVSYDIQ